MRRINCTDSNGRKFGLLVKDDEVVTQSWIDAQNVNRAKSAFGRTAPIIEWFVTELVA